MRFLTGFGAELGSKPKGRRIFCRACLDWSERRYHIGGFVGAEICRRALELGWVMRQRDARAVVVTAAGGRGLLDTIGVQLVLAGRRSGGEPERAQMSALWLSPNSAANRFSPVRVKLTTRLPGAGSRAAQFSSVKRFIIAAPSVPAR